MNLRLRFVAKPTKAVMISFIVLLSSIIQKVIRTGEHNGKGK